MKWAKVSLETYQLINSYNDDPDFDEWDKLLYITGVLFNKTPEQLGDMGVEKVKPLIAKTNKLFSKPFASKKYSHIGIYRLNYDVSKLRFGQYIELNYFLSKDKIEYAHFILASIAYIFKNTSKHHRRIANYFLKSPVHKVIGSVAHLTERFAEFNNEYSGLFNITEGEEVEVKADPFNTNYGWIYSATQIAEHLRVTLEEVYNIPTREALNHLSYLKAKREYDEQQLKKNNAG